MTIQTVSKQLTRTTKYKLNNGQWIPAAGFGAFELGVNETYQTVYDALTIGYRHIDSAVYYDNQKECARAIADFVKNTPDVAREDIWFTTKIFNDDQGYEESKACLRRIAAEVKEYLGYVDLVLIHTPLTSREKRLGTWKALQEINQDPRNDILQVHTIGVSNFGSHHIEELLQDPAVTVVPAINQLELHPWSAKVKLREYCTKKGIQVEAYSPLTRGKTFNDPKLLELEAKYKVPKVEILMKWAYLQGFVVLVKSQTKERIQSNFEVLPESHSSSDVLDDGSNLGKIDLDLNILNALEQFDTDTRFCFTSQDPTKFEG